MALSALLSINMYVIIAENKLVCLLCPNKSWCLCLSLLHPLWSLLVTQMSVITGPAFSGSFFFPFWFIFVVTHWQTKRREWHYCYWLLIWTIKHTFKMIWSYQYNLNCILTITKMYSLLDAFLAVILQRIQRYCMHIRWLLNHAKDCKVVIVF